MVRKEKEKQNMALMQTLKRYPVLTYFMLVYTWVYNNTKGSLFLMVLFHTVFDLVGFTILTPSTTWIFPVLYVALSGSS